MSNPKQHINSPQAERYMKNKPTYSNPEKALDDLMFYTRQITISTIANEYGGTLSETTWEAELDADARDIIYVAKKYLDDYFKKTKEVGFDLL